MSLDALARRLSMQGVGVFEAMQVLVNYMVGCVWPPPILMILATGVGSSPLGLGRVNVHESPASVKLFMFRLHWWCEALI